ncbi:hypothetical protein CKO41_13825 [Thiococcus pfennigii]|jgi:hypothetical protein|nr:hypothetical protein [Thiococcus pfennigii]MBK1732838.1 hypothetical protein [Thiococcus pfennigii]
MGAAPTLDCQEVDDRVERYPPRYLEQRLALRAASAREIRSQLLVLVHMVDVVGGTKSQLPWLTEEEMERRISERGIRLQNVEMHKPVSAVVHELHDLRMVDADRGAYRINRLGILHMWSHATRLGRHNARDWEHRAGSRSAGTPPHTQP